MKYSVITFFQRKIAGVALAAGIFAVCGLFLDVAVALEDSDGPVEIIAGGKRYDSNQIYQESKQKKAQEKMIALVAPGDDERGIRVIEKIFWDARRRICHLDLKPDLQKCEVQI